jgi:cell division septum initiation protein DivIVA
MTRLLTGKDLRHIEIGTHLISFNAYDVGEVDDLIDAAADSIDAIYKENIRLAKKCAELEDEISGLKADLDFTKYANLNNPVKENPNVSEENRTRLDGLLG